MILWTYRYLSQIPAVWLEGLLYCAIAVFGFLQTQLATDEAAKFITPQVLFWAKTVVGAAAAGSLAAKMFRSTTFAEHRRSDTQFFTDPGFDAKRKDK